MTSYTMEVFLKDLDVNNNSSECFCEDCKTTATLAKHCSTTPVGGSMIRYLRNVTDDVTLAKEVDRWVDILVDTIASVKGKSSSQPELKVLEIVFSYQSSRSALFIGYMLPVLSEEMGMHGILDAGAKFLTIHVRECVKQQHVAA